MKTVIAIIAGAAIQLAARFEVRRALTNASRTPITIAAGIPRNKTPRKMKTSPAVKLDLVLGMRIGFAAARITRASRPENPAHSVDENPKQCRIAQANTVAPAMTMTAQ